jgi:NAD(P)-dependent dehydrogenase (short-subunit alcohol dehydrogenase family)
MSNPGIVITGAGGDLGRALVDAFLADGLTVFAADLKAPEARPGVVPLAVDVTDRAAVEDLAARAGRDSELKAWVNGAGLFLACPVMEGSDADWNKIIAVNLTGTWHGCAAALPVLAHAGGGRIVNVGSVSGQVGGTGAHPAYGASKAGVHALTKTYAGEGARMNILCNAVAPGLLDGGMVREFDERQRVKLAQAAPLRRLGQMSEVARVIRFLAGPENTYMTGAIVPVNGGVLMP